MLRRSRGGDAADLKHATDVKPPSADQVERHRVSHFPYRSWCKQCVMGRGVGRPHATSTTESSVPIVGMDSFYITREGVRRRDEMAKELGDAGEEAITQARASGEVLECLLVRCRQSKNQFAHVVPQKGDDEDHYCAKLAVADVEWLGHTRIILKTDNERAIVALKHRVAKHLNEKSPWGTCKRRALRRMNLNPTEGLKSASRLCVECSAH